MEARHDQAGYRVPGYKPRFSQTQVLTELVSPVRYSLFQYTIFRSFTSFYIAYLLYYLLYYYYYLLYYCIISYHGCSID